MKKFFVSLIALTVVLVCFWACSAEDDAPLSEDVTSAGVAEQSEQQSNEESEYSTQSSADEESDVYISSEPIYEDSTTEDETTTEEASSAEADFTSEYSEEPEQYTPPKKEPEMIPALILLPQPEGEYHILKVGESLQLYSEIEGAGIEDAMLDWRVSDGSVISFSNKKVTALSPGFATVTLSYSNGLMPVSLSFMVISAEESSEYESSDISCE